jgi:hypothetical protein
MIVDPMRSFLSSSRFSWLLILVAFAACTSTKKVAPVSEVIPVLPTLLPTTMGIPIQVYAKPLLQQAEKMAPSTFTSQHWPAYVQEGCDFRYKYKFVRSGFQFQVIDNRILITMNGAYQIAGSKSVCAFDKQIAPWVNGSCGFSPESMRKVQIVIATQLYLSPQYAIRAVTKVEKIQAIDKCLVTALNMDLTGTIVDSIRAAVHLFGKELDASVAALDLRALTGALSDQLTKEQALKGYGFLQIRPAGIALAPLQLRGDSLYTTLGFQAYPEVYSKSMPNPVPPALPALTTQNSASGFVLRTNVHYDYQTLDSILNQSLGNRSFFIEGKQILVQHIDMSGLSNQRVQLKVEFDGFKQGTITLSGKPILDLNTQTLRVPDLDYDLATRDWLLRIGNALFAKQLLASLRNYATVPVQDLFQRNRNTLDALFNQEIRKGIWTKGQTNTFRLTGLVVEENQMRCQIELSGNLSVVVGDILPKR